MTLPSSTRARHVRAALTDAARPRVAAGACLALAALLTTGGAGGAEAGAGFFTEMQADAGEALYEQRCAGCHGNDVISTFPYYPDVDMFLGFIASTMPQDAPGGLTEGNYLDIVAYLLKEVGFPAGEEALTSNRQFLSSIKPNSPPAN